MGFSLVKRKTMYLNFQSDIRLELRRVLLREGHKAFPQANFRLQISCPYFLSYPYLPGMLEIEHVSSREIRSMYKFYYFQLSSDSCIFSLFRYTILLNSPRCTLIIYMNYSLFGSIVRHFRNIVTLLPF